MSRSSVYRMNKNPDSAFTLTIKNANDGGDVRIGIDEGDSWENLISFIRANKNDFDDLQYLQPNLRCFGSLIKYNHPAEFTRSDFYQLLSRAPPQNIDVILFGQLSHIQVDFNGTIYDIFCPPKFYDIKNRMLYILNRDYDIVEEHINLEILHGNLMTVLDRFDGEPLIYINKPIGRPRKVLMSIVKDYDLKEIVVHHEIPDITIQPIQTIRDIRDNTHQLSGFKLVINCENYLNSNNYKFRTLLYGIRKGWFDVVQLVITNRNRNAYKRHDDVDPTILSDEYHMFSDILDKCTISSTKKIILSVDIFKCLLSDISTFLEKTTIPMITIQSPNHHRHINETAYRAIEDAISRNENITYFTGLESDRIRDSVIRNRERKVLINRVRVQAGPDAKKNIIGFL